LNLLSGAGAALLELIYPRVCPGCGFSAGTRPWHPGGVPMRGLRPWDASPLCLGCANTLLAATPVAGHLATGADRPLPVRAAGPTHGRLVDLVGAWKYKGLRGLAWPLGAALAAAWPTAELQDLCPGGWVAMPLHRRRRRSRGFNQARLLAEILARKTDLPVHDPLLRRVRGTGQQAKVTGERRRRANVAGAFALAGDSRDRPVGPVGLVDDLVTSGATAAAAAVVLRQGGVEVAAVLALGWAGPVRAQVDSDPPDF